MDYEYSRLKDLVGCKISEIRITEDGKRIAFFREGRKAPLVYKAFGDCCSDSWIESVTGTKEFLKNPTILEIDKKDLPLPNDYCAPKEYDHGHLEIFAYDIKSMSGILSIEFRNESNGYYGGYLELLNLEVKLAELPIIITDDWI